MFESEMIFSPTFPSFFFVFLFTQDIIKKLFNKKDLETSKVPRDSRYKRFWNACRFLAEAIMVNHEKKIYIYIYIE